MQEVYLTRHLLGDVKTPVSNYAKLRKMSPAKSLYDRDYNLWQQQAIAALQNKDINNLDWENLIAEIEEVGKSQKRGLNNYTQRLIEHILKIKYWESEKERNLAHWRIEVRNFREQILDLLADSPSLQNYLEQNYQDWFNKSIFKMKTEFSVPNEEFIPLKDMLLIDFFG